MHSEDVSHSWQDIQPETAECVAVTSASHAGETILIKHSRKCRMTSVARSSVTQGRKWSAVDRSLGEGSGFYKVEPQMANWPGCDTAE